ncbi:hypothetical protein CMV_001501 [Castanea mollissima]|uniref:Uncharacterized protein n=1 Tax=Castanea mollissima TaxID=60419 RepID=A0A8J4RVT0_9ROSI|nr:hypothetical protein CMV_001501 [Castanea mollissima]
MSAADALVDYKYNKSSGDDEKRKSKDKGKDKQKKDGKKNKDNPHRARDCPKREKLNIVVAKDERGQFDEEVPSRVKPLQLLNALSVGGNSKGLSYVQVEMNENGAEAMLNIGATYNFVGECMVQQLGLKVSKCPSTIKAVNSEAKPVFGIAFSVRFKVGEWTGKLNFLIMKLDDFDVILGDEFFVATKITLLPFIGVILIFDEKQPCYVLAKCVTGNNKTSEGKEAMVLAMQFEHRPKKGEMTYLAAMIEVKIKESSKLDATYLKLVQDVTAGLVRRYWLEDGLLYAKGGKLFVPSRKIRRELLKETHDPQWARHPGFPSLTTDAQFRNSNLRIWSEEFWLLVGSI